MNTNRRHAVAALIAAGLLWGTTVPLTKLALQWLSPGWLTAMRFGLAAAVLLAALLITGRRRGRGSAWPTAQKTALRRAFTPAVLVAGALGYGGSVMVQNAGITRTSVTHAALLIGAVPVLVAIIAAVWHRTVARPVAWFGFAVSLGGVGLVTAGGGGGGATAAGDGLVLVSLLLSATVTVAQARLLTGRDPVAVTAVQFLGAALGSLPVAVITEGVPAAPVGFGALAAVIALALAGTLAPFTLFAFGQTRVSAEVAGAFLNLEPLVGAIAGTVVFGDPAGLAQIAGGMAILAGIALSSLPLLAGRRMARRAAAAVAASAGAQAVGAGTGARAEAGARAERSGAGVGPGRVGAEVPRKTRPPSPEPALVKVRVNSGERHGGRNRVFMGVRGGKFGAGQPGTGRPGAGRPRLAGARHAEAGSAPGRDRSPGRDVRHERTRPGGRAAGRPPARGRGTRRGTDGPAGSASGRRPGGARRALGGFRRGLPQVRA